MTIFWATQYRPEDMKASVESMSEVSASFAEIGARQTRLLVAITEDVGTFAIATTWDSMGDAVKAFDPVDGEVYAKVTASPTLSAQLAQSGPALRRIVGTVDHEYGNLDGGTYAVTVTQSTSAGPMLWGEASDLAWASLHTEGVVGMQLGRVLTGDLTGHSIATVLVDDVNHFTDVLSSMPPKLIELFTVTGTSTVRRNVHRIVRA